MAHMENFRTNTYKNIMKTSEAFKRLVFTIGKKNKPNETDIEALNKIIDDYNKIASENTKEHYLFAKLYAVILMVNSEFHGDVSQANKDINKILSEPLEFHLQRLLIFLKQQNLNNYFNSKDIYDPLLNIESYDRYKQLFPEVSKESIDYAFNAWNIEILTSYFEFNVNQSIINFKDNA